MADTRGDPLVWLYGSNDRRRVPVYHRFGNGRIVLGADKRFQFAHEGTRELFSVALPPDSSGSVFRDKNHPLMVAMQKSGAQKRQKRDMLGKKTARGAEGEDDFVSLRTKKRKRKDDSSDGGDGGDGDSNDSDSGSGSESSRSSASESEAESTKKEAEDEARSGSRDPNRQRLQTTLAALSRRVKEQPDDVDTWLRLVRLQDRQRQLLLGEEEGRDRALSQDEVAGIAEVKLSMLEEALKHVSPSSPPWDRLQLAAMRERAKTTVTVQQLGQHWEQLARKSVGGALSFTLWRERLNFELTSLSTFSVDRLQDFFVERLRYLAAAAQEAQEAQEGHLQELCAQMVYVFLRATRFLYDAGFSSRATGAWQALLEKTFARPVDVDRNSVPPEAGLAAFWDSEVPRIGETGAQGWHAFVRRVRSGDDVGYDGAEGDLKGSASTAEPLPRVDMDAVVDAVVDAAWIRSSDKKGDKGKSNTSQHRSYLPDRMPDMDEQLLLYEAWVVVERQRAARMRLPARISDDAGLPLGVDEAAYENDVFWVVVFDDIAHLLFDIPSAVLPNLQPLLIDAFLLFCQLPPAFATSPWIQAARHDPFLAPVYLGRFDGRAPVGLDDLSSRNDVDGLGGSHERPLPDFACDGSQTATTPETLFAQPRWFRYLPDWLKEEGEQVPVPPHWVATTLRQLVRSHGVEALAAYSLAVDAVVQPSSIKKAARALLRQYRSNIGLYNAYALAELACGHVDVARSVLASAMKAAGSVSGPGVADHPPLPTEAELTLRLTAAWLELEQGQQAAALCRLVEEDESSEKGKIKETKETKETKNDGQPSPARLLRARQSLSSGIDYALSMRLLDHAVLLAQSLVLLLFLAPSSSSSLSPASTDLAAALAAATSFSDELAKRSLATTAAHERFLQQAVARLLFFYAATVARGAYRPADLQAPLYRCIKQFPHNGILLRLFAWIDPAASSGLARLRRLRPDDPVRGLLDLLICGGREQGEEMGDDNDNNDDNSTQSCPDCPVSSRAFAVRLAAASSQYAALRELDKALRPSTDVSCSACSACRYSAALWQADVHVTAVAALESRGSGSGSGSRLHKKTLAATKDLYYQAVQACPGSKAVLLEAFGPGTALVTDGRGRSRGTGSRAGPGSGAMMPTELRAVFHTIVNKGLRVHVDLAVLLDCVRKHAEEKWTKTRRN